LCAPFFAAEAKKATTTIENLYLRNKCADCYGHPLWADKIAALPFVLSAAAVTFDSLAEADI